MHKAKVVLAKKPSRSQLDLRRWCIEQAIRWPMQSVSMSGGAYSGAGAFREVEHDLIGRAEKILAWVAK